MSPLFILQLSLFLHHSKHPFQIALTSVLKQSEKSIDTIHPLLCPCAITSNKWYQSIVLIFRLTPWEILKRWMHHKEFWRVNLWLDHHTLMDNTTIGGRIAWRTTSMLMTMSYGWSLRRTLHSNAITEDGKTIPKKPHEFDLDVFRKMEKNARVKKLSYFGLGLDEYTWISECESTKEIWNTLWVACEGTNKVKQSWIELLMRKYELFEMSDKQMVMDMHTRFSHITNEMKWLGKPFTIEELVRKILWFVLQL